MLNYERTSITIKEKLSIKKSFIEAVRNKDFLIYLAIFLSKTLLFIALVSDDKANGINFKNMFFSLPPLGAWIVINSAFLAIAFFFKGSGQKWCFWTLNLLFSLLILGDMWYYRSNSVFLNYHMFSMTSNLENLGSSIISMLRVVDILFFIDIIVLAYFNVKNRKSFKEVKRNILGGITLILVSLSFLFYLHIKIDKLDGGFQYQFLFRTSWSPNQTMGNLTPIGYHIYDAFDFYEQSKPYVFEKDELESTKEVLKSLKEDLPDNEYAGLMKGKNLIVIQWESLETSVINQSINGQEITPTLNKILSNSLYFNNFYEQTYSGTSSDAELLTNTSVFPVREGATFFRYPTNTYENSLPNIFKRMGYSTLASHPDKGSYWNWLIALKSMGYDECLDSSDYDTSEKINLGVSDKSYLNQFVDKVKELESPFMAYTITLTSHTPFDLPKDEIYLNVPENLKGSKLGGYYECINYTDKYIGELLKRLDKEGILDNTVVVIYGDHEGVHKFYDDEVSAMKDLEPWMKKNNKKVPFIIYNKNLEGQTFSKAGGQVDLLPTVSYLFGASKDDYNSLLTLGKNLLNTNMDYALLSNHDLVGDNLDKEEQEKIKSFIEISDKMIRGNYFRDMEALLDE